MVSPSRGVFLQYAHVLQLVQQTCNIFCCLRFMCSRFIKQFANITELLKNIFILTLIPLIICVALILYLLVFMWDSVIDLIMSISVMGTCLYPAFLTVYVYASINKFDQFSTRLDTAVCMFYESSLCEKKLFFADLNKLVNKANAYVSFLYVFFIVPPRSTVFSPT